MVHVGLYHNLSCFGRQNKPAEESWKSVGRRKESSEVDKANAPVSESNIALEACTIEKNMKAYTVVK